MLPSPRGISRIVRASLPPLTFRPHIRLPLALPPLFTRSNHDIPPLPPLPDLPPGYKFQDRTREIWERVRTKGKTLSHDELMSMIRETEEMDPDSVIEVDNGIKGKRPDGASDKGRGRTKSNSPRERGRIQGNGRTSRFGQQDTRPRGPVKPVETSRQLKIWIKKHPSPLGKADIDELLSMVQDAPKVSVNAAVWNQVLSVLGREKKYTTMWKAFNDMKRRGVQPTTRTYTVLINAYVEFGVAPNSPEAFVPTARPEPLTLNRVAAIYNQSQRHISSVLRSAPPASDPSTDDDGLAPSSSVTLASSSTSTDEAEIDAVETLLDTEEVNNLPTRAYLRFLGRYGLYNEMRSILVSMDRSGPLAPDAAIFTTMLHTLNNMDKYQRSMMHSSVNQVNFRVPAVPRIELGPAARAIWDQAVRQCEMDADLAIAGIQAFALARPEDQRLAESLIPVLFPLTAPDQPQVATSSSPSLSSPVTSRLPAHMRSLSRLPLSIKTATQLMSILNRSRSTSLAAHYTHQIIEDPKLRLELDMTALRVSIHNLSHAHDVTAILSLMERYNAPWGIDVYHRALSAARWSMDWDAALLLFRRMAHLPPGVENGIGGSKRYVYTPPDGQPMGRKSETTDLRGVPWFKPRLIEPDTKAITELIRTALATKSVTAIRQSLGVFAHYPTHHWFSFRWGAPGARPETAREVDMVKGEGKSLGKGGNEEVRARVELAKDVQIAVEKVLETARSQLEKGKYEAMKLTAKRVISVWG